jgi:hypothetical protein
VRKAQAQQYKDTSRPPRERRKKEAGLVPLAASSHAPFALSLPSDTIIRHTPAPDAIEAELWAIQKPGRKSLEGDKGCPAKS